VQMYRVVPQRKKMDGDIQYTLQTYIFRFYRHSGSGI